MSAAHSVRAMLPRVGIAALWCDTHDLLRARPETASVAAQGVQPSPLGDPRTEGGQGQ